MTTTANDEARVEDVRSAPSARASAPGRKRGVRLARRENLAGYAFMIPWLLGFVTIIGGPMIASLYLSFTDYAVLGDPEWIGLDNYTRMFTEDARFQSALGVTFTYLISVPLVIIVALLLALFLDRGVRGLSIYRAIFYIPSLIGGSVAIAILWRALFSGDGLLNNMLAAVGIHTEYSWIGNPDTALSTLILLAIWQFGASMLIFLAGIRQIPVDLYEAARMDGAGSVRQFFAITLPMLSPIILFNTMMVMVGAFQAFNTAYIVSNGTGGPADSTLFFTLYLYQRGFASYEMGYASALGWVLLVIVAVAATALFAASRRLVFYGDR